MKRPVDEEGDAAPSKKLDVKQYPEIPSVSSGEFVTPTDDTTGNMGGVARSLPPPPEKDRKLKGPMIHGPASRLSTVLFSDPNDKVDTEQVDTEQVEELFKNAKDVFRPNIFINDPKYYDSFHANSKRLAPVKCDSNSTRFSIEFNQLELLGSGSFADVYKAANRHDGCMYAVKQTRNKFILDAQRAKALQEARAIAALGSHPNIVRYHCCWFEDDKLFMQFELCDGSLVEHYNASPQEDLLLNAMTQMANVLQYIHAKGIVHLDIKPDNILVKDDVCKLGDFGCATRKDASLTINEGDKYYLDPEVMNERYDHLEKADIFSLGASFMELLRGSKLDVCDLHTENLNPLLNCSARFREILKSMVDLNPERRPSAKELIDKLNSE